ncbi:MAG: 4Fe-4S binding protein [Bacillota bacterium]|jgi:pyruvate ferredoxin oxidoreductase delta subunit|nr:4Fe-4S binding protein [Bacillota bacterium]
MSVPKDAGWKDVPIAGRILEPGSAAKYETGGWRTYRPQHVPENCIHCLFCWLYCPDMAVIAKDGKFSEINYRACKGCGVCAQVCPGKRGNKALVMVLDEVAAASGNDAK